MIIEIDVEMMGQEWRGSSSDLKRFCAILEDLLDGEYEVVAITDSCNGARNDHFPNAMQMVEDAWNKALELLAECEHCWHEVADSIGDLGIIEGTMQIKHEECCKCGDRKG